MGGPCKGGAVYAERFGSAQEGPPTLLAFLWSDGLENCMLHTLKTGSKIGIISKNDSIDFE